MNLLPKNERRLQRHDIANQVRLRLDAVAASYGARIKVAEAPPGPPVLETLVADGWRGGYRLVSRRRR